MRRALLALLFSTPTFAEDWTMGGRSQSRNPVSPEKNAPVDLTAKNIRWTAALGDRTLGGPVVANGLVWVGTNNEHPRDPEVTDDRGVLMCFRESDGKFLYQYTRPRLKLGQNVADWSGSGLSSSPMVEGHRLWFMTNRREVVCLDTEPLEKGTDPAKEVWKHDLLKEEKIFPHTPMIPSHTTLGSPTIYKDWLYVQTGNGPDDSHSKIPSPEAPCLVCFEKTTGKVVWKDASGSADSYGCHHASPLVVETKDGAQVIHGQADGWVRSFDAATGKLIWKFNTNKAGTKWDLGSNEAKHLVVGTPVYAEGRVYFTVGLFPEASFGFPGRLFCIDPTKKGDVSPEVEDGPGKSKPNPNTAVIWEFVGVGEKNGDRLGLSVSSVAVHDGFAVSLDTYGIAHCFDAKTGARHWWHDTKEGVFGGDPLIADGKIYITTQGSLTILELSRTKKVLAKHELDNPILASPVFANGTLFVATEKTLYAIGGKK